jgi:spoIIIJ-associated protein
MTIQEYIYKTVGFMGLTKDEVQVKVKEKEDRVEVSLIVPEDKASQFIGVKGRNLFALQHLIRLVFRDEYADKNIVLDINQYRGEKEEQLISEALRIANKVQETGQEEVYRNLNSYERYLIHSSIAKADNLSNVTTYSSDVDDQRWLTICLKENAPKKKIKENTD